MATVCMMAKSGKRELEADDASTTARSKAPRCSDSPKPARAGTYPERIMAGDDASDYAVDTGRTESQQVLGLFKQFEKRQSRKKDVYVGDFRESVTHENQELSKLVEARETNAARAKHNFCNEIRSHISTALAPLVSDRKGINQARFDNRQVLGNRHPLSHPYFAHLSLVIGNSNVLLADYSHLSKLIDTVCEVGELGEGWQEDCERLTRLLRIGKHVAEKHVDEVVQKKRAETLAKGNERNIADAKEVQEASIFFKRQMSIEEKSGDKVPLPLGSTLHQVERGVRRIARSLPGAE